MTRPSEYTRGRILKAAESLFAERGYQDTSVRAVVAKARVDQAAINYHFEGKDGLYREVLRAAIHALTEHQLAHAEELKIMSREDALAEFIKYQLRPLAARDQISRYYRIFDWETVRPTDIYRDLVSEEATPFLSFAVDLIRRFMPNADQRTLTMAAIWLFGQCTIFVRNREQLANPPVSLDLGETAINQLTNLVSGWALFGLTHVQTGASPPLGRPIHERRVAHRDVLPCLRDRRGVATPRGDPWHVLTSVRSEDHQQQSQKAPSAGVDALRASASAVFH
jgi:AcrR family transcriptional regulator